MGRKSINISLPETLESFARHRVKSGDFGTVSEYFRELLKEDLRRERARVAEARKDRVLDPRSFHRERYGSITG